MISPYRPINKWCVVVAAAVTFAIYSGGWLFGEVFGSYFLGIIYCRPNKIVNGLLIAGVYVYSGTRAQKSELIGKGIWSFVR